LFSILTVISLAAAGAAITRAAATKPRIFISCSPRAGLWPAGFSHARASAPDRLDRLHTPRPECAQGLGIATLCPNPSHAMEIAAAALSAS